MTRFSFGAALTSFLTIVFVVCTGCGQPTTTVKGSVTYQGKPVDFGAVVFLVGDNDGVRADIQPDGSYTATGVPLGDAKIEVFSLAPPIKDGPKANPRRTKEPPVDAKKQGVVIPATYNNKDTSGLKLTITSTAPMTFDIKLKDADPVPE